MANRYISIAWSDIGFESQQEMIKTVKESLLESFKSEGEEALKKDWHVAPRTWQEAYCRENDVDSNMWSDLEETSQEFQDIDWKYTLEEYAESLAETRLASSMKYVEMEVEI